MPMVRAMRTLNAIEAGTLSGAQLETLLTGDPGRLGELNALLGMRGQARRMAASSTAMNAVAASSTAMNAVIESSTAMNAVIESSTAMNAVAASSTAMNAVIESSTAMNAVIESSTAMLAVWGSDTALTAIDGSVTAKDALINAATLRLYADAGTTGTALTIQPGNVEMTGTKFLVVGVATRSVNPSFTITVTGGRAGSAFGNQTFSMGLPAATGANEDISTLRPKILAKDTAKRLIALDGVGTVSNNYTTRYMNFIAIQVA